MTVVGPGVNTTIATVVNATTITLTAAATIGSGAGTFNFWQQIACNADLFGTADQPYLLIPPAYAGQTIYIRVWPESGPVNGGTFEICTYDPIPPPNDNPCGALPVLVDAGCTQVSSTNQNATATGGIPVPSCGFAPYNDVWFTVTVPAVPAGSGVIINTASSTLNNASLK